MTFLIKGIARDNWDYCHFISNNQPIEIVFDLLAIFKRFREMESFFADRT